MLNYIRDIPSIAVGPSASIREMLARIDAAALGLVLVVDPDQKLIATVTDGDIRRALLAGLELSSPVEALLKNRGPSIALPDTADEFELAEAFRRHQVRHLPLLDVDGRVVALAMPALSARATVAQALVMAGGFGRRLGNLTDDTPKPMLPVRGRPMMAWVIDRIAAAGIRDVFVSLHYRGDQIRDHFGDGSDQDLNIRYIEEETPRGTAGAVSMIPPSAKPLLVINADVVCDTDLSELIGFHQAEAADMTMGVRRHVMEYPFGVVECSGLEIRRITEKPRLPFLINAGVYVLGGAASAAVPSHGALDMTDLAELLLNGGRRVRAYPISGDWIDIGRPDDYSRAQAEPEAVAPPAA